MVSRDEVFFENISETIETVEALVSTLFGVKLLDDRIIANISIPIFEKMGREFGPRQELRNYYNFLKDILRRFSELSWIFRSNQIMLLPNSVVELYDKLCNAEKDLEKLIEGYLSKELWKEFKITDKPWLPLTMGILISLKSGVSELKSYDPLEIIVKALEIMYKSGYNVQSLFVIRELIIMLLLNI